MVTPTGKTPQAHEPGSTSLGASVLQFQLFGVDQDQEASHGASDESLVQSAKNRGARVLVGQRGRGAEGGGPSGALS
jgi:hypothetical protein